MGKTTIKNKDNGKRIQINELIVLIFILIGLFVLFSILNKNFISYDNMLMLFNHLSYMAIVAAPLTIVFILGEIDLSFGGVIALTSMIIGVMYKSGIDIRIAVFAELPLLFRSEFYLVFHTDFSGKLHVPICQLKVFALVSFFK